MSAPQRAEINTSLHSHSKHFSPDFHFWCFQPVFLSLEVKSHNCHHFVTAKTTDAGTITKKPGLCINKIIRCKPLLVYSDTNCTIKLSQGGEWKANTRDWPYLAGLPKSKSYHDRSRPTSLRFLPLVHVEHEPRLRHLAAALEHTALPRQVLCPKYIQGILGKCHTKKNWLWEMYSILPSWRFTGHVAY